MIQTSVVRLRVYGPDLIRRGLLVFLGDNHKHSFISWILFSRLVILGLVARSLSWAPVIFTWKGERNTRTLAYRVIISNLSRGSNKLELKTCISSSVCLWAATHREQQQTHQIQASPEGGGCKAMCGVCFVYFKCLAMGFPNLFLLQRFFFISSLRISDHVIWSYLPPPKTPS